MFFPRMGWIMSAKGSAGLYIATIALIISIIALSVVGVVYNKVSAPTPTPEIPPVSGFDIFIHPGWAKLNISDNGYPMTFTSGQWLTVKSLGNFTGEVVLFFVETPDNFEVIFTGPSSLTLEPGSVGNTTFDLVVTGSLTEEWLPSDFPGWTRISLVVVSATVVNVKSFPILVVS